MLLSRESGWPFGLRLGIALLALLPVMPAWAGERSNGLGERWHLGIQAGQSTLRPDTSGSVFDIGDDHDASFTFSLGYDLSAWLSLEGYAADLGRVRIDRAGRKAGTISYTSTGLGVAGYLPLWGRRSPGAYDLGMREGLSLFGGAGIGMLDTYTLLPHVQNQDYHLWTTGGLEFGWKSGLALRLQWTSYDQDAANLGIALVKRFGRTVSPGLPVREQPVASPPSTPIVPREPVEKTRPPRRRAPAAKGFFQLAMPIIPIRQQLGRLLPDRDVDELLKPMALGLKGNPSLRIRAGGYYLPAAGVTAEKIGIVVDDVIQRLFSMGVQQRQIGIVPPKPSAPDTLLPANRIEFSIAPGPVE